MESGPSRNGKARLSDRIIMGGCTTVALFVGSAEAIPGIWEAKALLSVAAGVAIGALLDK